MTTSNRSSDSNSDGGQCFPTDGVIVQDVIDQDAQDRLYALERNEAVGAVLTWLYRTALLGAAVAWAWFFAAASRFDGHYISVPFGKYCTGYDGELDAVANCSYVEGLEWQRNVYWWVGTQGMTPIRVVVAVALTVVLVVCVGWLLNQIATYLRLNAEKAGLNSS